MSHSPADLTDEALTAAVEIARIIREHDGRLSARIVLAELEIELLERTYAMSSEAAR